MKADVKELKVAEGSRIIAISDVHGNLKYLKGVLEKAEYGTGDCLVLVGDYIEKGTESLNTLRFIMELFGKGCAEAVLGNCEAFVLEIINCPGEKDGNYLRYLMKRRGIIQEMCAKEGLALTEETNLDEVRSVLLDKYRKEFDFLSERPVILETELGIFVHAGLQSEDLENQDRRRCMKCDSFLEQNHIFSKYCIVGHWPVVLYHHDRPVANPCIDRRKKIIAIDGGCVLNDNGQLNALILSRGNSKEPDISWVYYDDYKKVIVADDQEASKKTSFNLPWTDNKVEVLEKDEEFSYCRHRSTGHCMWILNRYLCKNAGDITANGCTDYILPVKAGDEVSLIEDTSRGYLIKKDGCTGWYFGKIRS